nr:MAG TPA: hypothetical protein [Microviridae sp.]
MSTCKTIITKLDRLSRIQPLTENRKQLTKICCEHVSMRLIKRISIRLIFNLSQANNSGTILHN